MKIKSIKYFRNDGLNIRPTGMTCGWINAQIWKNENGFLNKPMTNSYILNDISNLRYGFSDYRGGMIVFSDKMKKIKLENINDILKGIYKNSMLMTVSTHNKTNNAIKKWRQSIVLKSLYVGGYTIGKNFIGEYTDINNEINFNKNSVTIELGGIPTEMLFIFGSELCKIYKQPSLLVKDFNTNKNYLIDSEEYTKSEK